MLTDAERRELELLRKQTQTQTQTIEQTGKTWKALQLLGGLTTAFGIMPGFLMLKLNPPYAALFLIIGCVGLLIYLAGKIGAWWHHA